MAELPAGARDVKRAALREEVHAAAIEWRLDAEGCADGLARGAGEPDRPHGQVERRGGDPGVLGDHHGELVERRHLPAGEDVRAAGGSRHLATQAEALDEVVDVRPVIEDLSVAENDELPARDAPEK